MHYIRCKEIEKLDKYQNLAVELQRLWNVKVNIVIGAEAALGAISPLTDWLRNQL